MGPPLQLPSARIANLAGHQASSCDDRQITAMAVAMAILEADCATTWRGWCSIKVLVVGVEFDRLDLSCALRPCSKSAFFGFNRPVRSLSKKHPKTLSQLEGCGWRQWSK